jgi:hypothetical protein
MILRSLVGLGKTINHFSLLMVVITFPVSAGVVLFLLLKIKSCKHSLEFRLANLLDLPGGFSF